MTMKILMAYQTNYFAEDQGGGVRYVVNLTRALASTGVHVTFLGAGGYPKSEGNVVYIPIAPAGAGTVRFFLGLLWARLRHIRLSESVVHVHRLYYVLPFLGRRIRVVCTLHGRTFSVFEERFGARLARLVFPVFRALERWLLTRKTALVAVSNDVIEQFKLRHGSVIARCSFSIIPSMIDLSEFASAGRGFFSARFGGKPVCLFVGRLAAVKNMPLLLQAWRQVVHLMPDARLVIVGDGEQRQQVRDLIYELKIVDSVFLVGRMNPADIPTVIASAQLLVLCSEHEASPTVVKEALACGVPVVSTPVGDVESVIEPGVTGLVVAPEVESLGDAILEVLHWNREPTVIAAQAEEALASCSVSTIAARYAEIYRS
jgi:L-malate glycosyltransferase